MVRSVQWDLFALLGELWTRITGDLTSLGQAELNTDGLQVNASLESEE